MSNFLSYRLTEKQFNIMAMHCDKNGVNYSRLMGNRLSVANATDSEFTALKVLEITITK